MSQESVLRRLEGLLLFFGFFLLLAAFDQINLYSALKWPHEGRRAAVLAFAALAVAVGLVFLLKDRAPSSWWRKALFLASAAALILSVIGVGAGFATYQSNWWGSLTDNTYTLWRRFGIILQGVAIAGTFFGVGRSRRAFATALTSLCLLW